MRKFLIAILFACSLAPCAHAQQRPAPTMALQDFVGNYVLSDGSALAITRQRQVLMAQRDGQERIVLQPAGPGSFAAHSGRLRIDFNQRPNGNVAGLTLTDIATPAPVPGSR
ncbi:MAG: hypothetical protein M3Y65_12175 [Pseudomonadota bacterium]|nr:hypothetical protein [Pseudomonadota bacterium]